MKKLTKSNKTMKTCKYLNLEFKFKKIFIFLHNRSCLDGITSPEGRFLFIFAIPTGSDALQLTTEPPTGDKIKRKILLVLRGRAPGRGESIVIDAKTIEKEVIFMELNKQILENLYWICQEVYMPVMSNPLNMMGWSDLVSKDLMDKFHVFLAHTYVTIG